MTMTLREAVDDFNRQALHAVKLGLIHPETNAFMEWQIELADDMKALLEAMRFEDVKEQAFDAPLPYDFGVDENGLYIGGDDDLDDFDDEDMLDEDSDEE